MDNTAFDHTVKNEYKIFRVGLTGGIACGKSSIASLFQSLGVDVIDADAAAREVVQPGEPTLQKVVDSFGREILNKDGSLNRRTLRQIVFAKGAQSRLECLNSIMKDAIRAKMNEHIDRARSDYVIVMIPLLFEHHLEYMVDRILVVDIAEDLQLNRLINRDNIDKTLALNMIGRQVDRATRIAKADDLITSDNSPLDKKLNVVLKLHSEYLKMAKNYKNESISSHV